IVDRNRFASNLYRTRQRQQAFAHLRIDERIQVESKRRRAEIVDRVHVTELRFIHRRELARAKARRRSARTSPELPNLFDPGLVAPNGDMPRVASRQSFRQHPTRARSELRLELVERLGFPLELETEVCHVSPKRDRM